MTSTDTEVEKVTRNTPKGTKDVLMELCMSIHEGMDY